jgi:hypothetical protein
VADVPPESSPMVNTTMTGLVIPLKSVPLPCALKAKLL